MISTFNSSKLKLSHLADELVKKSSNQQLELSLKNLALLSENKKKGKGRWSIFTTTYCQNAHLSHLYIAPS